MSHVDAENALKIYQHFCKQTERVVTYLGIAKKLQNVLNVQIPNLRHVSPFLENENVKFDTCIGTSVVGQDTGGIFEGPEL